MGFSGRGGRGTNDLPACVRNMTLRAALVITTAINLIPVTLVIAREGIRSPNLGIAIVALHWGDHRAGGRHRDRRVNRLTLAALVAELAPLAPSCRLSRAAEATGARDTRPRGPPRRSPKPSNPDWKPIRGGEEAHRVDRRHRAGRPRLRRWWPNASPLEEPLPAAIQRQCDRLAARPTPRGACASPATCHPRAWPPMWCCCVQPRRPSRISVSTHTRAPSRLSCRPRIQESVLR